MKEQGQILALTAQVEQLKLSKQSSKKPSLVDPNKPSKTGKKKEKNKWAWKNVMPKEGEPKTKDFKGRQYHINCKYHPKQWVCHSESSCSKNPSNIGLPPPVDENGRKLGAAWISTALSDPTDDPTEESQEDDY
jgi:hypothetical protein